jgi:hypothetical protein
MNMMKSLISTALALAALSVAGSAQSQVSPISIQGTPGRATLDLATGELTRTDRSDKLCSLVAKYTNTDYSGYYSIPGPGVEWIDWGAMFTSTGTSEIVGQYCTAYGTSVLSTWFGGPGATMCNMFYDNVIGWCAESGLSLLPEATFCFSGLPGSPDGIVAWGWSICVILTGGGEFIAEPGPFGYSMSFFDSSTGPLLMYAGLAPTGSGFDTNGQEDAFDLYNPDVATGTCGTYWFGGYPNNFSSWWLEIWVGDGDPQASCSWYCGGYPGNGNCDGYVVLNPAEMGGTFVGSVTACGTGNLQIIVGYSTPLNFASPWGEILVNFADPNGELLGPPSAFGSPAILPIGVPINLAFCNFNFFTQAISFGPGIELHCAFDCIVGF